MKFKAWRWVFVGVCLFLAVILLFKVRAILGPFFLAFVLAYLLDPLVEALERRKVSRKTAIFIVFALIVGLIIAVLFLILPTLYKELGELTAVLPGVAQLFAEKIGGIREQLEATGLPGRVALVLDEHFGQGEVFLAERLNYVLDHLPQALSTLTLYILSPVIAVYFLADWNGLKARLFRIVPQRWRMEWRRLWQDVNHVIRQFVRGDLVIAVIVGILVGIGVKLVGMEYALLIGIICGITDLIPYFGPVIGAVPAVLLALTISPVMALKVVAVIIVVQQLEGSVISPKLMGDSVGLRPLWIVFVLLAGEELAGIWGMLFAVPTAAVIRVVLKHMYFRLITAKM